MSRFVAHDQGLARIGFQTAQNLHVATRYYVIQVVKSQPVRESKHRCCRIYGAALQTRSSNLFDNQMTDSQPHIESIEKQLDTEFERENEFLFEQFSTELHPSRIKPAYWGLLLWSVIFALFLWGGLTDKRVPQDRRPILAIVTGTLILMGFLAMLLPKAWLKAMAEFFGCDPIESVLRSECKVVGLWVLVKQIAIICILIPLVRFGFEFISQGATVLGLSMIVVAVSVAFWTWGSMIYRPAGNFEKLIAPLLESNGYVRLPSKAATGFLGHSILSTDSHFEILNFWVNTKLDHFVGWGRYNSSGKSLSAGVFCVAEYDRPLRRIGLAETMKEISSVHFDRSTSSLFGTFKRTEGSSMSLLGGLPWQFLNQTLICRIDQDVLLTTAKAESTDHEFMQQIVESWELIAEQIHFEHATDQRADA